ncbi:cyclin-dependent kinase 2-associated protein 1-like [Sitophilus oryzae]|uniref:Cyclin-dependent kinase 2-associated protein 1-like n=1 Tax=Sitophilus oryzae TaxID=7048 RepID=A0A6J2XUV7_SITOR|nr:cyclin-dependent kinase 2-associated protein 1-like [Sitophilus oryzae]
MDTVDIQAVESKLSDVTVTAIPISSTKTQNLNNSQTSNNTGSNTPVGLASPQTGLSKYAQLLNVIEEMSREVRPTYAGSRSSAERLKRNIVSARILVRECLIETEKSARQ